MESSPFYQPKVWLTCDLNKKLKQLKKSSNNLIYDNLEDSDSDIECIEIVEVDENRVKSFLL